MADTATTGVKRAHPDDEDDSYAFLAVLQAKAKKCSSFFDLVSDDLTKMREKLDRHSTLRERAQGEVKERDAQIAALKAQSAQAAKDFERRLEEERRRVRELSAKRNDLEAELEKANAQCKAIRAEHETTREHLNQAESRLDMARRSLLVGVDTSGCVLLTTGQLMDLEGLVRCWMVADDFTGSPASAIKCPITGRVAFPMLDAGGPCVPSSLCAPLTASRSHGGAHRQHARQSGRPHGPDHLLQVSSERSEPVAFLHGAGASGAAQPAGARVPAAPRAGGCGVYGERGRG
jgi:hypothetical protein